MPNPEPLGPNGASAPQSVWQLKPWWCQPWSILLTGLVVMGVSWLLLHLWWVTTGVSMVIGAWWMLFLVLMPAAWKQEQAGAGSS